MLFVIYSMPESTDTVWDDLRLGTICDAVEWNYTKRFCGAGTFSLTIPRTSLFASQIEVGCMLALTNKDEVNNSEDKYEGFIVKNILRKNDTIKITGYDLNGLLLDRVTLAETQDGKDAQSGATETIVKHYVAANCAESTDADRNFPGFETAPDQGRGLVNDAASPRLSRVSDVVNDILGAAGMGYRIYPSLHRVDKPAIVFEVYEEVNRTDEQSENPRVIFSYGHKNITEMTRETGVTADRNTFYCEYDGGYVTRYDKKSAEQAAKYSGYGRREEFLSLSCELAEVEVYAEHEVADRYRETDSLEIVAGNPLDYGRVYNVGDIATVYDRDRGVKLNSVISAAEIKKTATEYSVNITLGDAKPKPLDILGKSGTSVAAVIRQDVGGVGMPSKWDKTSEYFNSPENVAGVEGNTFYAHVEGLHNKALHFTAHAEGFDNTASGAYSHAEGLNNTASGNTAHVEGQSNTASGIDSHAEGLDNTASGLYSHAEGLNNTASGEISHAEGNGNTASGVCSHTEGEWNTITNGVCNHVEGENNKITDSQRCRIDGHYNTIANASDSSVGGASCSVERASSAIIHGSHLKVSGGDSKAVFGSYNEDGADIVFAVGAGTGDGARKNAIAVDRNGNLFITGDIYINGVKFN